MADSPVARSLGPLETIVNVSWAKPIVIAIQTEAEYTDGTPGTRKTEISLTQRARDAGATIVAQKTFQVPVNGPAKAKTVHRAVLAFRKTFPGDIATTDAFSLVLSGAIVKPDDADPNVSVPAFCGTSTSTSTYTTEFIPNPVNPNQPQILARQTTTFLTPAGVANTVLEWLCACNPADVPASLQYSATSQSIWYVDGNGNYVDTHDPCSRLDDPDYNPTVAKRIEGFQQITLVVAFGSASQVQPVGEWLVEDAPEGPLNGLPRWQADIPRINVGLNADNNPIFDDIPNGTYAFKLQDMIFNLLQPDPPQTPNKKLTVPGAYPSSPAFVEYGYRVTTIFPDVQTHTPVPDTNLKANQQPPSSQVFD